MKPTTEKVIFQSNSFEDLKGIAPDLEKELASRFKTVESMTISEVDDILERRYKIYKRQAQECLFDLGIIEYGLRWGECRISQREARYWTKSMKESSMKRARQGALHLTEELLKIDPSDVNIESYAEVFYAQSVDTHRIIPYSEAEMVAYLKSIELDIENGRENRAKITLERLLYEQPNSPELNYRAATFVIESAEKVSQAILRIALPYAKKAVSLDPTRSDYQKLHGIILRFYTLIDAQSEKTKVIERRDFM